MLGGKIVNWAKVQRHLAPDVTGSWSGTSGAGRYQFSASLETRYVFNVVSTVPGLSMVYSSVKDPSVADWWRLDVDIPDLGIVGASYGGASWQPGQECIVEFQDVHLWETLSGLWRMTVGAVVISVAGSVVDTFVTSGYTLDSYGLGPCYTPLFGGWDHFTAEAQAGTVGASGNYTASSTVSGTVQGGWRFKETAGGAWRALPVKFAPVVIPECDSHCQLGCISGSGIVSGTTTHNVTIAIGQTVGATLDASGAGLEIDSISTYGGDVYIIPDLEKGVSRQASDYAAMIERGGLLQTTYKGARYCYNGEPYGGPGDPAPGLNAQVTGVVHPRMTDFLAVVGNPSHVIEDPFKWHSFSWATINNESSYFRYVGGIAVEQHTERVQFAFPDTVDAQSDNPQIWAYLNHLSGIVRYVSYNCHPHWHYKYFPFNGNISGSPALWEDYWAKIGHQHLAQPALPAGEKRLTRTTLISAPLLEGGNVNFIDTFLGGKTSWWGNCRLHVDDVAPVSSKTLDSTSSAAWSSPDTSCTLAHAGSITVTSLGGATVKIRLNLGRFSEIAWLYTLIARRIAVNVTATNVTSWTAKLTGLDGDQVLLATANGTYDFPLTGTASKYAGTWGQDFGAGYLSDTGSDFTGDGDSAAAMADPERLTAFEYLPSKNAAYLDFELVLTNPALTATIAYPTFYAPTDNSTVVQESRLSAAILWPNGPLARWGQLSYWDYLLDVFVDNPPAISGQNTCATILDWLCFKRQLLQGKSATDGLDAEWAAMFESVETTTRRGLAYDTLAYIQAKDSGLRAILVNTYSPPPLAHFPSVDALAASRSSQYNQIAYCHAQEPRRYAAAGVNQLDIVRPSDSAVMTTPAGISVPGHRITQHSQQTDGSEAAYDVYVGGQKLATARFWHGYSFSGWLGEDIDNAGLWHLQTPSARCFTAHIEAGNLIVRSVDDYAPVAAWRSIVTVDAAGDCSRPQLCFDPCLSERVYVVYARAGGKVYLSHTDDDGRTWSTPSSLASMSAYFPFGAQGYDGSMIVGWAEYVSGSSGPMNIKAKFRGPGDTSWSATQTLKDAAGTSLVIADGGIGNIEHGYAGHAPWTLFIVIDGETTPSVWFSTDVESLGMTFKRLT